MDDTLRRIRAENGIIRIGKMGEIPPAIVEIPIGKIQWGAGRVEIKFHRAGDTGAYLAEHVEIDGSNALWYLSEADLCRKGAGEAQVVWYAEDGHRLKSDIYRVIVDRALEYDAGEPDVWTGVCDRVAGYAGQAERAAESADTSAKSAQAFAAAAAESAGHASEECARAGQAAQEADQAAVAAAGKARLAEAAAEQAGQAAQAAEQSKAEAENAGTAAENAKTAAQTATEHAETAERSAAASLRRMEEQAGTAAEKLNEAAEAVRKNAEVAEKAAADAGKSAEKAIAAQLSAENAKTDAAESAKGAKDAMAGAEKAAAQANANAEAVAAGQAAQDQKIEALEKAGINDGCISAETPWSSKKIIDMLCPALEETGNPVTCYPVAGYPLGVVASWAPTQAGEGEPYPAGGGKNLFNPAWMPASETSYGITWTISPDGTVTANGMTDGSGNNTAYYNSAAFDLPTGTYTIRAMEAFRISIIDKADNTLIAAQAIGKNRTFTIDTNKTVVLFLAYSGAANNVTGKPQIEKGSTATDWAPYENIRPISGRESVAVERCGENVIELLSTNDSSSTIKIAVDSEKNITLNGTVVERTNIVIGMCRLHWVAGKTYTMYVKKVGGSVSLGSVGDITFAYSLFTPDYNHYFRGDTNSTNLDAYIASNAALAETKLVFMLQCWRVNTVFNNFKFQIEVVEGTTAPTTYTPYRGDTLALALPSTVYGGTVDAVTGEGEHKWGLVTFDGSEAWTIGGLAADKRAWYYVSPKIVDAINEMPKSGNEICSHYPHYDVSNNNTGKGCALVWSAFRVRWGDIIPESTDAWKSYLAAQYAAGTPVQIAYKLVTPTPIHATGAQPVPALAGCNTVLTDADSATVTGRADPAHAIAALQAQLATATQQLVETQAAVVDYIYEQDLAEIGLEEVDDSDNQTDTGAADVPGV